MKLKLPKKKLFEAALRNNSQPVNWFDPKKDKEKERRDRVAKLYPKKIKKQHIYSVDIIKIMLSFLLQFASKIVGDAVKKIPDDAELGEKLVEICIVVLEKAVKLTKTTADDKLLESVKAALVTRDQFL